jgi:hypothetical protein
MPPRTEHADALKPRLQRAHDGHHKPRLQMLERLASGHTPTRQEVARVLGGQRPTSGRWLALSAAGGLEPWLQTYVPAGKSVALAPAVRARLEEARQRPAGGAS